MEGPCIWLDGEEVDVGRDVGLVVHAALERLPLHEPAPDATQLQRMIADASAEAGLAVSPAGLERALLLTEAFWRSPVGSWSGLIFAEKEVPFCFEQGGLLLSGVIDLLCRSGDSWTVVDYKTNALRGRSPSEVAATYDLQCCVYCLAALKAGAREVTMEFLFLEQPESPVCFTFFADDVGRLEAMLDVALAEVASAGFPAERSKACPECPLEEVCAGLR